MLLSQGDFNEWPSPAHYERHRPEATLLYQIIEEYWPSFQTELDLQGKSLPHFVAKEFEEYLKCGRLEHGFLRVRCESCHDEKLVAFSQAFYPSPTNTQLTRNYFKIKCLSAADLVVKSQ